MLAVRQNMLLARGLRTSIVSSSRSRNSFSTQVHRLPTPEDGGKDDFRAPWVYTWTRLCSYTIIPSVALYGIFVYDFGDREHVFQPIRRWATRRKAAFFKLSPEEEQLLKRSEPQTPSSVSTEEP